VSDFQSNDDPVPVSVTKRAVVSSALWNTTAAVLSIPVLTASTVLTARILGAGDFGRLALYTFLFTLLGGVTDLGLGSSILRRGAVAAGRGDRDGVLAAVRAGTTWSSLQIPWTLLLAWIVLPSMSATLLYFVAAFLSLGLLGPSHYLVMTSDLRLPSLLRLGTLLVSTATTLSVAAATHRADMTFAATAISNCTFTALQVVGIPKGSRRTVFVPGRLRFSRKDLTFGVGTMLNEQLNVVVFSRSELIFFGRSQSVARGRFAAAQTIASRSTLLLDALLGNLSIGMASARGRGDEQLARALRLASDSVIFLLSLSAPAILAGVAVFAEPVFGSQFPGLATSAVVLSAFALLQTSAGPLRAARFAERSIGPLIASALVSAAVDVALAALLVRATGVLGAVVASATGSAVYVGFLTATFFRSAHRAVVLAHSLRAVALLVACMIPALILRLVPDLAAYAAIAPVAVLTTAAVLRLPGISARPESLDDLTREVLPARILPVIQHPWLRRYLGLDPLMDPSPAA
jgi:O-antigen/teichoic acid export membrane protein